MAYSAPIIECLRFAGRTGGIGIGCCAIDIFQGFNTDPDAAASIALKHGDSGTSLMKDGKQAYLGPTNRDIFLNYLRIGTFDTREMPNRVFLAAITRNQVQTENGKKWLALLREQGFEFIRATDNSVYTGTAVGEKPGMGTGHPVYIFGLFRNISSAALADPFAPPAEWTALPEPTATPNQLWLTGKTSILTEEEVTGKAPVAVPAQPNPF